MTTCKFCGGAEHLNSVAIHPYTKLEKIVSSPCVCYISRVVSSEHKLLGHMGDQYLPFEKIPKQYQLDLVDKSKNDNLIINGDKDAFFLLVKGVIMSHRFDFVKPRILFSRSIDIVHDYYVPRDDGVSLHLSATSLNDLVILEFGTQESNKAIAPCMAQIVQTRLDEEKPTWIYFPPTMPVLAPTCKEFSSELLENLEKEFKNVELNFNSEFTKVLKKSTRAAASQFGKAVENPPEETKKKKKKRVAADFGKDL